MPHCAFCRQASPRFKPTRVEDIPLLASPNFVVWASIGSLIEGWLLVVPRVHVLALAGLPGKFRQEFDEVTDAVSRFLLGTYGVVTQFEHGPGRAGSAIGCSIDHAHMHVLPTSLNLVESGRTALPGSEWNPVSGVGDLRDSHSGGLSYLFARLSTREAWATVGESAPSQFFRRIIAAECHLGHADWRSDPRMGVSRATVAQWIGTEGKVRWGTPTNMIPDLRRAI